MPEEDDDQIAEDFLQQFQDSLEFGVADGTDGPIVDQEFHCLMCMKKDVWTKLIVMSVEEGTPDPLVILECHACEAKYRMCVYLIKGVEVSLDFMVHVEPVKPPATMFEMAKRT